MKKVFSNAEQTIHVWAQQTQSEGESGNVFFEGATVYSYGYHYPLGLIATNKKGEKAAIINSAGYSVTTRKHIDIARYAVNHYMRFSIESTEAMKGLVRAQNSKVAGNDEVKNALSEAILFAIARYHSRLRSDTVKRRPLTLVQWKNAALAECDNYVKLLEWYGVKMTPKARAAIKALEGASPIEAREAAKKAAEKEEKKRAKKEAQRKKENAVLLECAITAWIFGYDNFDGPNGLRHSARQVLNYSDTVYLRINGDNIETSRGAEFPVSHGIKAWPLIKYYKDNGKIFETNGKQIHLGNFKIDRIEADGTIKAGCHTVPFEAVENIAKQLNLI